MPRALAFVVCLCALSSVACVKKPTMHLDHAEVTGVQLAVFPPQLGVLMTVVVNIYNPNSYDVAVRAMRGEVVLANMYTLPVQFQGPPEGVWLPSDRTTQMRVPIQVPVQMAVAIVQQSWASPTIPFRMQGKADVTATRTFKIESDDYSVDEQGYIQKQQIDAVLQGILMPHR